MKKPGFPIQLGTYKEIIFLSDESRMFRPAFLSIISFVRLHRLCPEIQAGICRPVSADMSTRGRAYGGLRAGIWALMSANMHKKASNREEVERDTRG